MPKYEARTVGSLGLDVATATHFRSWLSFSSSALRRKLLYTMRCGVSHELRQEVKSPQKTLELEGSKACRSERLSVPPNMEDSTDVRCEKSDAGNKLNTEALEVFRIVMEGLQSEDAEGRKKAAAEVRLLAKEDPAARVTLGMLGAIPVLVGLLDLCDIDIQIQALYALLNLAIGNDKNKDAVVRAGAVHKMLKLTEESSKPSAILEPMVANFLSLSALDTNKAIIGSSGAINLLSYLLQNWETELTKQSKEDSLRALLNLSISPANIPQIVESELVQVLLSCLGDMEISERVLSILSNIVSTPEGRRAVASTPEAFPILIDVLNWTDSPCCQEKASYILMVMAHKMRSERQAMVDAGITSALLELALLGSTLAQKRASRILECLKVNKGKQVSSVGAAVSAPLCDAPSSSCGVYASGLNEEDEVKEQITMTDERRAVKQLVQQSLWTNMRRILTRANMPQAFAPSEHFRKLTASSTSKSLPL